MKTLIIIFLTQINFPISVEKAKSNILNNPKLSKIIHYNYNDSTITNDLILGDNPTKENPYYLFEIRQFQIKINHSTNLHWLKVNAKNGKIYFYNPIDEKLSRI